MLVYRAGYCNEVSRIKKAKKTSTDPLEDSWGFRCGSNTFEYDESLKYIHFFLFAETAWWYWSNLYGGWGDIIQCDIPNETLTQFRGFGYYNFSSSFSNPHPGYAVPIPEFSIPLDEFKLESICDVQESIKQDWLRQKEYCEYLKSIPREYLIAIKDGKWKLPFGDGKKAVLALSFQKYM